MYKLILFVVLAAFHMTMYALQVDEELALHTLFRIKHALNRSAHAAALQLDQDKLARGVYSIDSTAAQSVALSYLQQNLHLDSSNTPEPGSFLNTRIDVLVFKVINENDAFPYIYTNESYDYTVTLDNPGVVMIIRAAYPRIYNVMDPITWKIKAAAEIVYAD